MRGDPLTMELLRPRTAKEALGLLARRPEALPLAGGTDLMVAWNAGLLNGKAVLDLSRVRDWSALRLSSSSLRVGALATHSAIRAHAGVRRRLPLLAQACATVGAVQIQNRGTLGGNIANASPAGDTFPPLAVYGARVRAVSAAGAREIPFLQVFAGVKKTTLKPGELIESIELPLPGRRPDFQIFRKVGTRAAQAISKVAAAGLLWLSRDKTVSELRFALGSVAPTVRRLSAAEAFLRGRRLTPDAVEEAARLVDRDISPIDDLRSTRAYRLGVSKELLRRFLLEAAGSGGKR